MNLERDIERARRAKEILEDPLFVEAMQAIREECQSKWEASRSEDTERRERIWLMLKIASKFQDNLSSHLGGGVLAQAEIAELDEAEKRKKRLGIF
jgi:hypothetical protein